MIVHIDLSKLKPVKYKKLIEKNPLFIQIVDILSELGIVFYVSMAAGSFIRASSKGDKEAKKLQSFLIDHKLYEFNFDKEIYVENNFNKAKMNSLMDDLFWDIYKKVMMDKSNMPEEKVIQIIEKLKEEKMYPQAI